MLEKERGGGVPRKNMTCRCIWEKTAGTDTRTFCTSGWIIKDSNPNTSDRTGKSDTNGVLSSYTWILKKIWWLHYTDYITLNMDLLCFFSTPENHAQLRKTLTHPYRVWNPLCLNFVLKNFTFLSAHEARRLISSGHQQPITSPIWMYP